MRTLATAIILTICGVVFAETVADLKDAAARIETETQTRLQVAYDKLVASIKADSESDRHELELQRLAEAQKAWIAFREAQVAFVATHANIGSASARMLGAANYSKELTELRIKDLENVPNPF